MSRAYVVYILMFAVLAGGLWVIYEIGGAMRAPDDLSGDWKLTWATPPPPQSSEPLLHIDQSGRFFVVRLGKAKPISMTLRPGWRGARDGRRLQMELAGQAWTMRVDGEIPLKGARTPEVNVELAGPSGRHSGRAVLRGYEPPATHPAAGVARAR